MTPAERMRTASMVMRTASGLEEVAARRLRIEAVLLVIEPSGRTAKTTRRRGALTAIAIYWRFRRSRG